MASKGTVVFRGRSGATYRFQVWPLDTKFKPLAAVCVFSKRSYVNRNFAQTASHECVHIGQTSDLSQVNWSKLPLKDADCICIYLAVDEGYRRFVEKDLADQLGTWDADFQLDLQASSPVGKPQTERAGARGTAPAPED